MKATNMDTAQPYKVSWLILIHVLLWCVLGFVLLLYPPLSWDVRLPAVFWVKQCLSVLLLVGIFYLNYFWTTPIFLFRDRIGSFFLSIAALLVLVQVFNYMMSEALSVEEAMAALLHRPPPKQFRTVDIFILALSLLVLGISTAVAAVQRWQKDTRQSEELQKQQISAELAFLKAQINPHFFFNTLNNIYSLSYTDVELSREALHTLSRMMRYLLYETQQNMVSLQKEIDFIRDHIALMSLRLHPHNQIVFDEPKLNKDFMIAPMLFLPFVENALKYGTSPIRETQIYIVLEIISSSTLHFRVENDVVNGQKSSEEAGGIGLQNTKRRLDLQYPSRHTFLHRETENRRYIVDLKLDLT